MSKKLMTVTVLGLAFGAMPGGADPIAGPGIPTSLPPADRDVVVHLDYAPWNGLHDRGHREDGGFDDRLRVAPRRRPEPVLECFSNEDCSPDWYCLTPLGDCDGPGRCVERLGQEVQCLAVWDPVCGCDGETYSNACYAAKAAVSIDYAGECVEACRDDADCPREQYCVKPLGECDGVGECVERLGQEVQCLAVWDPVCGCDGQTYSNACYAAKAAVSIDYLGECIRECVADEECPPNWHCAKPVGECDGVGECVPRPDACYTLWDPVCGCDGRTYSNDCCAARAGVSVDYEGECRD